MASDWSEVENIGGYRKAEGVPEREIVAMLNGPEWAGPLAGPCPNCRGGIATGSLLYCDRCSASGFDERLRLSRLGDMAKGTDPSQQRKPDKARAKPDKRSRREKREQRRQREFERAQETGV